MCVKNAVSRTNTLSSTTLALESTTLALESTTLALASPDDFTAIHISAGVICSLLLLVLGLVVAVAVWKRRNRLAAAVQTPTSEYGSLAAARPQYDDASDVRRPHENDPSSAALAL